MEPIDRVSAVGQIVWTLIIFFILYLFVLFVILPKIHKVLRIRNYLFDEKAKQSLRLNYMVELVLWNFMQFRKKNIKEAQRHISINNKLHMDIKQNVLRNAILEIISRIQEVEFKLRLRSKNK
jgi:F0F1-type ATP synthase membrane subunit b/b'